MLKSLEVALPHALFSCYRPQGGHVHAAETLNIKRPALLVCLVVELRVDFCHFILLSEFEIQVNRVNLILFTPINEVCPHELHVCKHEFARPAKPEVIVVIVALI